MCFTWGSRSRACCSEKIGRASATRHTGDYNCALLPCEHGLCWRAPARRARVGVSPVSALRPDAAGRARLRSPDGTLLIGGEVIGTIGATDDDGVLQLHRLRAQRAADDAAGARRPVAADRWIAVRRAKCGPRISRHVDGPRRVRAGPAVAIARVRHPGRPDPPSFGAFGRRAYNADNPLIGYPLAYQYLTSLRADAIPATADDLLRMRGARLAVELSRSATTSRARACRSSARSAGTPASRRAGAASRVERQRRRHGRHAVGSAGRGQQRRPADLRDGSRSSRWSG